MCFNCNKLPRQHLYLLNVNCLTCDTLIETKSTKCKTITPTIPVPLASWLPRNSINSSAAAILKWLACEVLEPKTRHQLSPKNEASSDMFQMVSLWSVAIVVRGTGTSRQKILSLAFMHGPVTCECQVHRRKDNIFASNLCQKYYLALGNWSAVRFGEILLMTAVKLEFKRWRPFKSEYLKVFGGIWGYF